jgi:hypothetical protein
MPNTDGALTETCLVADLISFFETSTVYHVFGCVSALNVTIDRDRLENGTGLRNAESIILYSNIFSDVRESIDLVHNDVGFN